MSCQYIIRKEKRLREQGAGGCGRGDLFDSHEKLVIVGAQSLEVGSSGSQRKVKEPITSKSQWQS